MSIAALKTNMEHFGLRYHTTFTRNPRASTNWKRIEPVRYLTRPERFATPNLLQQLMLFRIT